MGAQSKKLRTSLLLGSAAWLLALSLACGGSGDDDDEASPASEETAAVEPAAAIDPFQAHGSTIQRLSSELQRLANSSPQAFRNPSRPEDRLGGISHWRRAHREELRLTFRPRPGGNGETVIATLARTAAGEVFVVRLMNGGPADAGAPFTAPPPVAAVAQTLRLQIMDHGCELPIMDQTAAMDLFGVHNQSIWQNALQVPTACAAAAAAFQATPLTLSAVSVRVAWARSGRDGSRWLEARIDSGAQLRFSRPEYYDR